jgi:NTP pyrophosphatase (non-canonical NTP hydrolase)
MRDLVPVRKRAVPLWRTSWPDQEPSGAGVNWGTEKPLKSGGPSRSKTTEHIAYLKEDDGQIWEEIDSLRAQVAMGPSLTFARFQQTNVKRCTEAFKHELGDWTPLEWAGAMCGEAGEAANICKKIKRKIQGHGGDWALRRDPSLDELIERLGEEIGDTVAYLALLAASVGLDLGTCAAKKFDKISDEAGWNGERLTQRAPCPHHLAADEDGVPLAPFCEHCNAAEQPATGEERDALRDLLRYVETIGCDETNPAVVAARAALEGRAPDPARGEASEKEVARIIADHLEMDGLTILTDHAARAVLRYLATLRTPAPARGPAGEAVAYVVMQADGRPCPMAAPRLDQPAAFFDLSVAAKNDVGFGVRPLVYGDLAPARGPAGDNLGAASAPTAQVGHREATGPYDAGSSAAPSTAAPSGGEAREAMRAETEADREECVRAWLASTDPEKGALLTWSAAWRASRHLIPPEGYFGAIPLPDTAAAPPPHEGGAGERPTHDDCPGIPVLAACKGRWECPVCDMRWRYTPPAPAQGAGEEGRNG